MSTAAETGPREHGRRRVSGRTIAIALTVVVVAAMALDTTYKKGDFKPTASGRTAFDPATYGKDTFPKAASTLEGNAVPVAQLLRELRADEKAASAKYGKHEGASPYAFAVSGEGVAGTAENGLLPVTVAGVPKSTRVSVQIGPALNGTAVRDAVGFVKFGQFTNQVEYADAATSLNNEVKARVLKGVDAQPLKGKRVKFVGAFTLIAPGVVTVTPVKLEASP